MAIYVIENGQRVDVTLDEAIALAESGVDVYEDVTQEPAQRDYMGTGEGFDVGDVAEVAFPWTVGGVRNIEENIEQGGDFGLMDRLGLMGRGVADAATIMLPGGAALRGLRALGGVARFGRVGMPALTALGEGAIGAGMQTAGDVALGEGFNPLATGLTGAIPLAPTALGTAFRGARRGVGAGLESLGDVAARSDLSTSGAVLGSVGEKVRGLSTLSEDIAEVASEGFAEATAKPRSFAMQRLGKSSDEIPASVLYGPNSKAAQIEKTASRTLDDVNAKLQGSLADARNYYNEFRLELGGGADVTPVQAGEFLQQVLPQKFKQAVNENTVRYSTVGNQLQNKAVDLDAVIKASNGLDDVIKQQKMLLKVDPNNSTAKTALAQLQGLQKGIENVALEDDAFEALNLLRESIGSNYFGGQILDQPDAVVKAYKKLYGDIADVLHTTVRNESPDLAKELSESNSLITELMQMQESAMSGVGKQTKSGEQVFRSVTGATKPIRALKAVLDPEEFAQLQSAKLYELTGGDFPRFQGINRQLRTKEAPLKELFADNIDELDELTSFGALVENSFAQTGKDFNQGSGGLISGLSDLAGDAKAGVMQTGLRQAKQIAATPNVQDVGGRVLAGMWRAPLRGWATLAGQENE